MPELASPDTFTASRRNADEGEGTAAADSCTQGAVDVLVLMCQRTVVQSGATHAYSHVCTRP